MIISRRTKVWTSHGWKAPADLSAGDTIISYNPDRNCTEYDCIQEVRSDYVFNQQLYAIKSKQIIVFITPDHPLMINDNSFKMIPIGDNLFKRSSMIFARPFEPYKQTADIEDIRWSARYVALFSKIQFIPELDKIKKITQNMSGHEAQAWLEEFYRWNILIAGKNWMKSSVTKNTVIKKMVLEIGARAGVGVAWWSNKMLHHRALRITSIRDASLVHSNYGSLEHTGYMFDLKTKNKNFLVARREASFLIASSLG